MGLATAAKRALMSQLLEETVTANAKNPKKLIADLQKLYASGVK
jgi:hypothetical protein